MTPADIEKKIRGTDITDMDRQENYIREWNSCLEFFTVPLIVLVVYY